MTQKPRFLSFICLIILSVHFLKTSQYSVYPYFISDLETTDLSAEAGAWTVGNSYSGGKITYCYNTYLLGGYGTTGPGTYFERAYTNLPPHVMIHYVINFWFLDSWDSNDKFYIAFDGTTLTGFTVAVGSFSNTIDHCGNSWLDTPNWRVYGTVYHYGVSLTLRVTCGTDEPSTNESFGIRNVELLFDQNPAGTNAVTMCGRNGYFTNPWGDCNCNPGYYYTGSVCAKCHDYCTTCFGPNNYQCFNCVGGTNRFYDGYACQQCDATCATCFGTASNQCSSCAAGYYYFSWTTTCYERCIYPLTYSGSNCIAPCASTLYYYQNGVCDASCPSPLYEVKVLGVVRLCINPCGPTEYIYWDGTCQQECVSPLTMTRSFNIKYCNYNSACTAYLRWDGACAATCDAPYRVKIVQGKMLCLKPCPGVQNVFWNGNCMDSCTSQLTVTSVSSVDTCTYPCATNRYLYWDYSCLPSCPYPLHTRTERDRLYCDYPTNPAQFLYWDGTSSIACDPPRSQTTQGTGVYLRNFCNYGCPVQEFLYWDGSCAEECLFPLTAGIQNSRNFCTYACGTLQHLWWDGTCHGDCPYPLSPRLEGPISSRNLCDYPCLPDQVVYTVDGQCASECAALYDVRIESTTMPRSFCDFPCPTAKPYMYRNGTCMSSCNSPLVSSTFHSSLFCDFPCADGQFLYYNGTCHTFCDTPFVQRVVGFEKYCNLACPADGNYYYYWNGSCETSCPQPYVVHILESQKWCVYPCLANQFMTLDGSCLDTCEMPLTVELIAGFKYCLYGCESSEYLYWNQTCKESCPAPLRIDSSSPLGNLCLKPCHDPQDYYSNVTGECVEYCLGPSEDTIDQYTVCLAEPEVVNNGTILDIFLDMHSISEYLSFAVPVKMLQYVKYLDMTMPPRLKRFTYGRGRTLLSLRVGQAMSAELNLSIPKSPIPEVFEKHGLHSRFLMNFWGELMTWAIVLVSFMVCYVLEGICVVMDLPNVKSFFEKLRVLFKWNFLLVLVGTSLDEVILYASLEFRTLGNFDQDYSIVSLLVCFATICMMIAVIFFTFYLANQWKIAKQKALAFDSAEEMDNFVQKWHSYQVIFRGFIGKSQLNVHPNHWFWMMYMVRMGLPMFFAAWFYFSPLTQIIFYMIISHIALGYIFFMRPLIRRINYIQLLIIESIIYIINIALFILQLLSMKTAYNNHLAAVLGDIILAGNFLIDVILVVFLLLKLCQGINAIKNYHNSQPIKHRGLYLQLLVSFAQQTGMGFEEFFIVPQTDMIFNHPKYLVNGGPKFLPVRKELDMALKAQSKLVNKETSVIMDDDIPSRSSYSAQLNFLKNERSDFPSRSSFDASVNNVMIASPKITFRGVENLEPAQKNDYLEDLSNDEIIEPLPRFGEPEDSGLKLMHDDSSIVDLRDPTNVSIAEFRGIGDEPYTLDKYLKTNPVNHDHDEGSFVLDDKKRRHLGSRVDGYAGRRSSVANEGDGEVYRSPRNSVPSLAFVNNVRVNSPDVEPHTKRTMQD